MYRPNPFYGLPRSIQSFHLRDVLASVRDIVLAINFEYTGLGFTDDLN